MLRILGQISISGTKKSIDRCAKIAPIPAGTMIQAGLRRKVPAIDSWCYASPRYRFHLETIDDEVRDFIAVHAHMKKFLALEDTGITYALFTLCPVEQSEEESFACVLSHETLQALSDMCVGFQISPASVMPDAPYWVLHSE